MRKQTPSLLLALALATGAALAEEQAATDALKAAMGEDKYQAAGLDKLDESERATLYRWLQDHGTMPLPETGNSTAAAASGSAAAVATTKNSRVPEDPESFGFPEPEPDDLEGREELQASILPPFNGWKGKTYFKLDNGQVWQQRRSGRFVYRGDDLRVKIYKNAFGFYDLRLIDADRAVGVKRVR